MIRKTIKIISNIASVTIVVLLLTAFVYVVLNLPAISKRFNSERNDNVISFVEASTPISIDNGMVWDEVNFDTIFLSEEAQKWQKEYAGKYNTNTLVIPSIDVEAPFVYLDSVEEQVLQERLKEGVGHYPGTALPGEVGNSFVFGHSSYYWWEWSEYTSVFANLEQIEVGDMILAYYDDQLYIYKVKETKVITPTDLSVLEQGKEKELTLMTCTPLGTDLNRFIVVAELIN